MERKVLRYFRDSKRFFSKKGEAYFAHLPNGHIMVKVQKCILIPSTCCNPRVTCISVSSCAVVSSKRTVALVFHMGLTDCTQPDLTVVELKWFVFVKKTMTTATKPGHTDLSKCSALHLTKVGELSPAS